jgi:hypothetical protein
MPVSYPFEEGKKILFKVPVPARYSFFFCVQARYSFENQHKGVKILAYTIQTYPSQLVLNS